jgi:hypothetical protein
MSDKEPRGRTVECKCVRCGGFFTARIADRKRGWARYCSKSCKAVAQEAKTGQHREYMHGREIKLCFPSHAEGDVQ